MSRDAESLVEHVRTVLDGGESLVVADDGRRGDELAADLVATGDRGIVAVTTDDTARRIRARVDRAVGGLDEGRLRVVSARGDEDDSAGTAEYVRNAGSPDDVTGIGTAVTACATALEEAGYDRWNLLVSSLSTMLLYGSPTNVFEFCHVLTAHVRNAEGIGVFRLNPDAHDDRTVATALQPFDGVVELGDDVCGTTPRIRGFGPDYL